jgi:Mg-chelatase subunit ChlD
LLTFDVQPHRRQVLAATRNPQKLFVRLRLGIAPEGIKRPKNRLALSLAVDTSGSMRAKLPDGTSKLQRAIEAIAAIQDLPGLGDDTEIALIQFDDTASVIMPRRTIGPSSKTRLGTEANQLLNFSGGTRLGLALELISTQLRDVSVQSVKKAVILTDGETTDVEECLKYSRLMQSEQISLILAGIGTDYNEDFLANLADNTNGFLYHLAETDESMIGLRQMLTELILHSKRELVTDVGLRFDLTPHFELESLTRVFPMVQPIEPTGDGTYLVGNVGADTEVDLIAEFNLAERAPGNYRIAALRASYNMPSASILDDSCVTDLEITYTNDAEAARDLDPDVVFFVKQARLSALANAAVKFTRQGKLEKAKESISLVRKLSRQIGNVDIELIAEIAAKELATRHQLSPNTLKEFKVGAKTKTIMTPPTRNQGGQG